MIERHELTETIPEVNAQPPFPDPASDWIDQSELADLLSVSQKTASCWAKEGRLLDYEHGFPHCGRRKYSRTLIMRDLQRCWSNATRRHNQEEDD